MRKSGDPGYGGIVALIVFLLAGTTARLASGLEFEYEPPRPGTYQLPVIREAGDALLLDSADKPVHLRDWTTGRITVVSFIYTRCRDARACPYAASVLNVIHEESLRDPVLARNLRLVSISFDPEHDTPKRMAEYGAIIRDHDGGCDWRFATPGSKGDLATLLTAYNQAVDKATDPAQSAGPLNHILRVYLIDEQRRVRNIYSSGTLDARLVLADIRTLLVASKR